MYDFIKNDLNVIETFLYQLQLYQVLTEHWQLDRDSLKLLDQRRIGAHSTGWQVFTVTDTIKQWVNDTRSNHG